MPFLYGNLGVGGGGSGGGTSIRGVLALNINENSEMEASSETLELSTDAAHDLFIEELNE